MLAAVTIASPATAQEILVAGHGLETPPGDAAFATVEIHRNRIDAEASGRIEDLLADVAGVAQFRRSDSRSAHPTSQGVTLRGLGGNASSRALVTLDGVPQADPFGGWVPFPAYLPQRLARVRVTRGGGSALAGPGALAGTIDLSSGAPADLGTLRADIAYGNRNSIDARAVAARDLGSGSVTIAGQYGRGDGFVPVVAEDRGPVDRAAPYEQASLALRGVADLGGNAEVQANLSGFADRRDRGIDDTAIRSDGADASIRVVGRGAWRWSALAYLQTRQFASGFASVNAARDSVSPALDQYRVPSTGVGGRIEIEPPLGAGVTLRIGADARHVSGRTQERYLFTRGTPARRRQAGGQSLTFGSFADLSIERARWTFSLGGRADRWEIRDGSLFEAALAGGTPITATRFADRGGWEASGRAGIAWHAGEGVTLRTAAYRGWRLPTLNELYRPYRVGTDATAANAALAPERLSGAEAGVDWTPAPGVRLSVTGYWNRLDGAIANVTLGQGPGNFPGAGFVAAGGTYRQRQNVDAVKAKGVEADARWSAGPWWASASWAYGDASVEASGAAAPLDGLRPAQTARHQASATLGWRRGGWAMSLTGRYIGPQYEDDLNRERLDDALTLDAVLRLPLTDALSAEARAENLADARVEAGISGAGIVERASPRTLWIALSYRLR